MNAGPNPPTDDADRQFATRLLADHERLAHASQLNAAELVAVRELLEADRRWKWIASGLKTWAVWIVAIVAGGTVGIDALKAALNALGK